MTTKRKISIIALIFAGIALYALPRMFNIYDAGMSPAAGFLCLLFAFMLFLKK